jgi:hypothetical protein
MTVLYYARVSKQYKNAMKSVLNALFLYEFYDAISLPDVQTHRTQNYLCAAIDESSSKNRGSMKLGWR